MPVKRNARPESNRAFSAGDAVQHQVSGEVAVVVERLGRTRLVVSLEDRTTTVWYASNVRTV